MENLLSLETPIVIPPLLAKAIGGTEAALLQALHFKLKTVAGTIYEDRKWFHNSYKDWGELFGGFFSERRIRAALENLVERGFIIRQQLSKSTCFHEYYYSIKEDCQELKDLLESIALQVQVGRQAYQEAKPKTKRSHRRDHCDHVDAINVITSVHTTPLNSSSKEIPPTPQGDGEAESQNFKDQDQDEETSPLTEPQTASTPLQAPNLDRDKYSAPPRRRDADKAAALSLCLEDYRFFRQLLTQWAEVKGAFSVPGFVRAEIENAIESGKSPRLDEFKQGLPLGIAEKQEWQQAIEVSPGVCKLEIYPDALEYWLSLEMKEPGTSRTAAIEKLMPRLRDRSTASAMWEEYKRHLVCCRDRANEAIALGATGLGEIPSLILNRALVRTTQVSLPEAEAAATQLLSIASGDAPLCLPIGDKPAALVPQGTIEEEIEMPVPDNLPEPFEPIPADIKARFADLRANMGKPKSKAGDLPTRIQAIDRMMGLLEDKTLLSDRATQRRVLQVLTSANVKPLYEKSLIVSIDWKSLESMPKPELLSLIQSMVRVGGESEALAYWIGQTRSELALEIENGIVKIEF